MFNKLSSLLRICKSKGLRAAYYEVKGNWLYDIIYKTNTALWLPTEAYNKKYNTTDVVRYQATHTDTIDLVIDYVADLRDKKVNDLTLLDLGSGKGKVLSRCLQRGLSFSVGIELNEELTLIARNNIGKVSTSTNYGASVALNMNCLEALSEDGVGTFDIIFMYNPFTGELMEEVLSLLAARKENCNFSIIAYVNPEQHSTVNKYFSLVGTEVSNGGQYINFYQ